MSTMQSRAALFATALAAVIAASPCTAQNGPVAVTVAAMETVVVAPMRRVPAEVMTLNRSRVAAEIDGIVQSIAVKPGVRVRTGDALATIAVGDYELERDRIRASIASTRARIDQARLRLKQATDLSRSRFVSSDERLARETDLRVLDAELAQQEVALATATRNVERTRITAPFDGVVTERMAAPGAFVRRGDAVVMLTDVRNVELEAAVPEGLLADLEAAGTFTFTALGQRWPVTLDRISPVTDRDERTGRARFAFGVEPPRVGTSGEVEWTSDRGLLPARFLARRGGILGVFVVADGKARFVPLVDAREGRPAEHTLAAGTLLVTGGAAELNDGDALSIRTP